MSLLIDCAELDGCLQTIHDEPNVRDFVGDEIGQVRLVSFSCEQDLDLEVDFLVQNLPSHVASITGESRDGSPWALIVEHAPIGLVGIHPANAIADGELALEQLFERATFGNPTIYEDRRWVIDPQELLAYYRWAIDDCDAVIPLTFCQQLRGLVAEVCGYPITQLVQNAAHNCAFPDVPHDCQGELIADVFQGWLSDGGGASSRAS